jgi:acyl-CoA reductase-like NAD-dependent aldehyde dehydrogenase
MEETFGPVVGIMKVEGDEEALQLMNDSPYGLVSLSILLHLNDTNNTRPHQYGQTQMIKVPCKSSRTLSKSLNVVPST